MPYLFRKEEKDGNVLSRKTFSTQEGAVRSAKDLDQGLMWTKGEQFIWADGEQYRYTILKTS